jgi:prepilin-type N-terminal cleavage/methylation domain-containing protein
MRRHVQSRSGLTLIELSVTSGLVGILGLIIYSLLNIGTILGAKNTAVNTAHQQARVAMLQMLQDLHSAVSLPALQDVVGNQAAGIAFQQWAGGPHKIYPRTTPYAAGQKVIQIVVTTGQPTPLVGQRLIVPTHQIESDIDAISGSAGNLSVTLHDNLPVAIAGTTSTIGEIICYITDRCSYNVVQVSPGPPAQYKLQWTRQGTRDIVTDITNPRPFSIPSTPAGALYYRFVAAIDLSTSDPNYNKRGYKAANILLNGQVPFKARLTTYQ